MRRGVQLREDAKLSLNYLSQALQIEVMIHIHSHWLEAIWFVRDLEASVKVRIALSMVPRVIAPGEIAPPRFLYVLSRGKVMYGGRILSRGNWWGDDVILSDARWFVPFLARAISYTDVTSVSSEALNNIVSTHPTSYRSLRRSTVFLALRRAIVIEARRLGQFDPKARRTFDFMDRVDDAAKGLVATEEQNQSMNIALELSRVSSASSPMKGGELTSSAQGTAESFKQGSRSDGLERVMSAIERLRVEMVTMSSQVTAIKDSQASLKQQLDEIKPGMPMIRGARLPAVSPRSTTS